MRYARTRIPDRQARRFVVGTGDWYERGYCMSTHWTRRQFLTHVGVAAAAIQTFEHIDPCCVFAADAKTADKDLFELKQVADGV